MNFEDYETLPTNNVLAHMTAGAIAGVMEHCIMYPLDSVKAEGTKFLYLTGSSETRMQSLLHADAEDGIVKTFLRMVRNEGLLRPVRGMPAVVFGAGPAHALYFSSYEFLKDAFTSRTSNPAYNTLVYGLAGGTATVMHDAVMNPAEVVKQRMQMYKSPYKTATECLISVYRAEGAKAFYRSYTTQLTMNVPFQSIHFMVYEMMRKMTNREGTYNPVAHIVSGAMAGGIAAAITTPLDVCKTLLNTQQGGKTKGLKEAVRMVYRLGGPMGYFRGMQARILYTMPSTAICWSTYEFFKYILTPNRFDEVRLTPSTVLAENDRSDKGSRNDQITDKINVKPRELPAMSAAGLYGSISFNTMHNADASFGDHRTDGTILDFRHT